MLSYLGQAEFAAEIACGLGIAGIARAAGLGAAVLACAALFGAAVVLVVLSAARGGPPTADGSGSD